MTLRYAMGIPAARHFVVSIPLSFAPGRQDCTCGQRGILSASPPSCKLVYGSFVEALEKDLSSDILRHGLLKQAHQLCEEAKRVHRSFFPSSPQAEPRTYAPETGRKGKETDGGRPNWESSIKHLNGSSTGDRPGPRTSQQTDGKWRPVLCLQAESLWVENFRCDLKDLHPTSD